jgi:hypothetical protein
MPKCDHYWQSIALSSSSSSSSSSLLFFAALVDLNGRFFGGREVQAMFYDVEKFKNLILTD